MALFFVAAIAIAAMPGPHWPDSPASIFASAFVDLPPTGPIFTRGALRPLRAKADGDSVGGCDGVGFVVGGDDCPGFYVRKGRFSGKGKGDTERGRDRHQTLT